MNDPRHTTDRADRRHAPARDEPPTTEDAHANALHRAFGVVAGDLPPTPDLLLGEAAFHQPGWLDKRVLLQDRCWYDIHAERHDLATMGPYYRENVLAFLAAHERDWHNTATVTVIWEALVGATSAPEARDRLDHLDLLTPGWTAHTPLGRALHHHNGTHPQPLEPPPATVNAADSDQPDTLHDQDGGTWQVTTASGSTYLIDLDHRRILRTPAHHIPQSGGGTEEGGPTRRPASSLDYDDAWTDLDALVQCRVGRSLCALDHRREGPGYRMSTLVTAIHRSTTATEPQPGPLA